MSDVVRLRATIVVEYDANLEHYSLGLTTAKDAVEAAQIDQLGYEQGALDALDFVTFDDVVSVKVEPA